jgi:hypothetical protein
MLYRRWLSLAVILVLVASVPAVGLGAQFDPGAQSTDSTNVTALQQTDAPPDPESDRLGWENGYWHNESIDVTSDDGLNDAELDAVVARSMARVEYVRGIEFAETPPVEIITRSAFTDQLESQYANLTESDRLLHNTKYEALFMVGENESSVAVQRANQGGGVAGFYDPEAEEIKLVSNNGTTPKLDEITLSQELFHALQDQRYNISAYNQTTRELHNARDGIIEGDGNYVDHLYNMECTQGVWESNCLLPESGGAPAGFDPHLGLYQLFLQPYSSGPAFVQDIHRSEGWEAVNEIYEEPPASTEQTIHPEKYDSDEPMNVSIEDTSSSPWRQLELNRSSPAADNSVPFAQFGEAGLYTALWYPGAQSQGQTQIIPVSDHINSTGIQLSQIEPYLYDHPATTGWDGDKLVPYVTDDSADTNETGYVYKLVWDSASNATEFREAWLELLSVNGATSVDGSQAVYRIPDDEQFGDAFWVTQDGDTVRIVNAPTVADLSRIDADAPSLSAGRDGTGDDGGADGTGDDGGADGTGDDGGADGTGDDGGADDPTDAADEDGAGFTLGLAFVALVVGVVLAVRRVN